MRTYNQYTEGKDESARFWFCFGVTAGIERKDYTKATEYLTKSLSIVEDNATGHHYISNFYIENNEPDKAISHYERAKILNVKYDNDLEFWKNLGPSYYKAGNYLKANEYYKKVLASNSNDVDVINTIVEIYQKKLNDYPNAIVYLNKIHTLNPNDINPLKEIASVYMKDLKDYDSAEKYYKQILEKGNDDETIINWGLLYEATDKYDSAIDFFLKIKPKLMDFGSGGSKDTYSNRDYCVANYYLARAYKRKGDKQNALKHVNIGYKLFGVGMDNISHNLNDLETAIKKMP